MAGSLKDSPQAVLKATKLTDLRKMIATGGMIAMVTAFQKLLWTVRASSSTGSLIFVVAPQFQTE